MCINYKQKCFSELFQLLKFVSLLIHFLGNLRCYENWLYSISHTYGTVICSQRVHNSLKSQIQILEFLSMSIPYTGYFHKFFKNWMSAFKFSRTHACIFIRLHMYHKGSIFQSHYHPSGCRLFFHTPRVTHHHSFLSSTMNKCRVIM